MSKTKPYRATSLKSAERQVRSLRKLVETYRGICDLKESRIKVLLSELRQVSMLAAEGPCFDNPLHVAAAVEIRNRTLREMHLNPDGAYIKETTNA